MEGEGIDTMGLLASGLTDIGRKRKSNQDSIHIDTQGHYFIVADGMGGHRAGDVASKMAVELAPKFFLKHGGDEPALLSQKAAEFVHENIRDRARKDESLMGMGTTFDGLFFKGSILYLAHVGDSRCYLLNRGQLFQLSRDHSLVQDKVHLGIYTREQARADRQKNILTRALGLDDVPEVDIYTYRVSRLDIFLACSDGLHGKVSDPDILHIITSHIPDPRDTSQKNLDQCVQALVSQANANGGEDNISVVLVAAL